MLCRLSKDTALKGTDSGIASMATAPRPLSTRPEIQARAGAKEEKLTGRRLAQAAKAHRQAVSYRGAAVARPFPSQNEWFPVLSGRHGERRQTTSIRQWSYHGGNLCGWRRRRVSVTPYAIRARFPSTA